ncbi:MAG: hypothetical protein LBK73_09210 [Treponema sp.]|jgi:hypothetical protein|nr:hypothetical protein [Treponema sp.]
MKNFFKLFEVIALAVIIGFGIIGCSDSGGDNNNIDDGNDNSSNNQPLFSVSGEFKGAGSGNALFNAATAETVSMSARSAAESYELIGELEDGDMLFRLKGTYDSSTGSYTASSASSIARYTIKGDESGATATLAVKSGEEWNNFIVNVTVGEVSLDAQDYAEDDEGDEGGLPLWAQGNWHDWWSENHSDETENSFQAWSYFNQWYYEASRSSVWKGHWDSTSTKYTVVNAQPLGDGVYDVIFSYPVYKSTDAQKKTALENFFRDIKIPAEFWNKKFDPWDKDVWNGGEGNEGKNYDNSVIWYICMNEKHPNYLGISFINWDTFKTFFDTEEKEGEFWAAISYEGDWWERKNSVDAFFTSKNISNYYYWGSHEPDVDYSVDYTDRAYTCWDPVCEDGGDGGWWQKTHYYLKWGNQIGIQGDWEKYGDLFNKWSSDDYLITYLRSQNVQPETWYTRVRIWKEGDTFMFFYYNGDHDAEGSHAAPACDTKSLSKIESLTTFDPENYSEWSYSWRSSERTSPR